MAPKRFKEVPRRDPSTPAGGKTALSGDSSFQARISLSQGRPRQSGRPGPSALGPAPHGPRGAPLGLTCFCTSASLSAMAAAVTVAVTMTVAVAAAGLRRRARCRRWPPAESDPVPVTAGAEPQQATPTACSAYRRPRPPTAPPTSCPAHSTTGPIGMQITCDVTLLYKARRVSRHFQCENSLR